MVLSFVQHSIVVYHFSLLRNLRISAQKKYYSLSKGKMFNYKIQMIGPNKKAKCLYIYVFLIKEICKIFLLLLCLFAFIFFNGYDVCGRPDAANATCMYYLSQFHTVFPISTPAQCKNGDKISKLFLLLFTISFRFSPF